MGICNTASECVGMCEADFWKFPFTRPFAGSFLWVGLRYKRLLDTSHVEYIISRHTSHQTSNKYYKIPQKCELLLTNIHHNTYLEVPKHSLMMMVNRCLSLSLSESRLWEFAVGCFNFDTDLQQTHTHTNTHTTHYSGMLPMLDSHNH